MATLNHKPYCVGLTGGIATGKTTVSHLFSKLGVPIIDADIIARELTEINTDAYHQIHAHFGDAVINNDKTLNRKIVRDLIFENASQKKWLENLLHPLIRKKIKEAIANVAYPYCICVIPLLVESQPIDFIDRVLVVTAPEAMQIARATSRDQSEADQIKKIIHAQAESDSRLKIADDVIYNNDNIDQLEARVLKLHDRYLETRTK